MLDKNTNTAYKKLAKRPKFIKQPTKFITQKWKLYHE